MAKRGGMHAENLLLDKQLSIADREEGMIKKGNGIGSSGVHRRGKSWSSIS